MTEDFLAARTRATPDAPALIFEGRAWTYVELNAEVAGVCARLAAAGVGPGDRVGSLLGNVPETIFLVHALIRLRAVIVPLNLRLTAGELNDLADRSGLDWLVHSPDAGELVRELLPASRRIAGDGLAGGTPASDWSARFIDPAADWGLLFTSGTTGAPRGAVIPLAAMQASAVASAFRLGTLPNDRWLLAMPLHHVGGLSVVFRCCLYGTAVVLHAGFDPGRVWESLEADRVSLVSLVPTMLKRLLEAAPGRRLPGSVRLVLLGGASAGEALVAQALDCGVPLALTYGLTEAASQVATALPEAVRRWPRSVGAPLMRTTLRIANPNIDGSPGPELRAGEIGEIFVLGPTVMRGYLGELPLEGWLRTGDIGFIDAAAGLTVLQRRTDLIVSGGENVYPAEIERMLEALPGVREACVVGLPDETWGQRVAAVVVPNGEAVDVQALQSALRERLAGYKLPREILFVEELPCTASGKVCRPDVAALFGSQTWTTQ